MQNCLDLIVGGMSRGTKRAPTRSDTSRRKRYRWCRAAASSPSPRETAGESFPPHFAVDLALIGQTADKGLVLVGFHPTPSVVEMGHDQAARVASCSARGGGEPRCRRRQKPPRRPPHLAIGRGAKLPRRAVRTGASRSYGLMYCGSGCPSGGRPGQDDGERPTDRAESRPARGEEGDCGSLNGYAGWTEVAAQLQRRLEVGIMEIVSSRVGKPLQSANSLVTWRTNRPRSG